ncbi:uncharacterized protein K452DRAFT_121748 [Aplosporella prunicola CBS 121167]|uniref:Uncharacterized protein n=1 Tax=Aplosporella prunicola CBS 121167 TaxID=1176127 RepID=A0A6A6BQM3_9PEZI|nr:uncharacterized protein K452DRAFT_121748 [Aplosporella prunicola CBS 121167]KAF2145544.1 hypothetical protein K452DRAFT_121748 [Aplosporella prunicola CBS 121167]
MPCFGLLLSCRAVHTTSSPLTRIHGQSPPTEVTQTPAISCARSSSISRSSIKRAALALFFFWSPLLPSISAPHPHHYHHHRRENKETMGTHAYPPRGNKERDGVARHLRGCCEKAPPLLTGHLVCRK